MVMFAVVNTENSKLLDGKSKRLAKTNLSKSGADTNSFCDKYHPSLSMDFPLQTSKGLL